MYGQRARSFSPRPSTRRVTVRERLPDGPLSLSAVTGAEGYVYVAGRLAAVIDRYHIVYNRVSYNAVPSSVDPFLSRAGACSHLALVWRGACLVYRVESGSVADGSVCIQVPSLFRLPSPACPGLRLPMV
jgi:hypothetical protein